MARLISATYVRAVVDSILPARLSIVPLGSLKPSEKRIGNTVSQSFTQRIGLGRGYFFFRQKYTNIALKLFYLIRIVGLEINKLAGLHV